MADKIRRLAGREAYKKGPQETLQIAAARLDNGTGGTINDKGCGRVQVEEEDQITQTWWEDRVALDEYRRMK